MGVGDPPDGPAPVSRGDAVLTQINAKRAPEAFILVTLSWGERAGVCRLSWAGVRNPNGRRSDRGDSWDWLLISA